MCTSSLSVGRRPFNQIEQNLVGHGVRAEVVDQAKLRQNAAPAANRSYGHIAAPPRITRPVVVAFA